MKKAIITLSVIGALGTGLLLNDSMILIKMSIMVMVMVMKMNMLTSMRSQLKHKLRWFLLSQMTKITTPLWQV